MTEMCHFYFMLTPASSIEPGFDEMLHNIKCVLAYYTILLLILLLLLILCRH